MGFEVVAIGRGADKGGLARKLGAHHYIDSTSADPGGNEVTQVVKGVRPCGAIIAGGVARADRSLDL